MSNINEKEASALRDLEKLTGYVPSSRIKEIFWSKRPKSQKLVKIQS